MLDKIKMGLWVLYPLLAVMLIHLTHLLEG
jgi:hypothetical protein